jgi:DNA-binding transcriptional ArsR family regulator
MKMSSKDKLSSHLLFFKALSNETRLAIIDLLRSGDKTVSEIVNELGFEQSRVSHNLQCLTFCGFIKNRRDGKKRIYSLNKETIEPLLNLVDKHVELYAKHLYKCKVLRR